jgi:hypothetical protein
MLTTYRLFRGVPYSGLDLDDLKGRGGYGMQMLGSGLYTTDEHYVAEGYAQPESPRFREYEKSEKPCVYELELAIPEDQILYLDNQSINMVFCEASGTSAIPSLFGIYSPAFEFTFKDRETGEDIWYLISETEDPLEYAEDFKLECANSVLSKYGLGQMGRFVDFDEYLEDDLYACEDDDFEDENHESACKAFIELAQDDFEGCIERIQQEIEDKIREASGLPHYGQYDEAPNVFWGGDSTELTGIAANHGYKVLWCSGWISSGDEIVIVDDSIYDNGLSIVDDCT